MIDIHHPKTVLEDIKDEIEISWSYFIQLFFASIIAVLGLLTNSTAVVIGAMLISPIFWPILGLSIGIITTKDKVLQKASFMLVTSILITLALGYVITLLTPMDQTNTEILARTNPTILDLFIALASSIIGILALFNKKLSSSAAGVAISIALLPPLATAGIGIAFWDLNIFLRAFILFMANVSAIVVIGVITLYLLKIRPSRQADKKRAKVGIAISTVFFILISGLLSIYSFSSIQESRTRQSIIETLTDQVTQIHPEAELENIKINFSATNEPIVVESTLLLPEQVFLTLDKESELTKALVEQTNQPVKLKFNILNTLLLRQNDENQESIAKIEQFTKDKILNLNNKIIIDNISSNFDNEDFVQVDITLRSSSENFLTIEDKNSIQNDLSSLIQKNVNLSIAFIPFQRLQDQSREEVLQQSISNYFKDNLNLISPNILVQSINVIQIVDVDNNQALDDISDVNIEKDPQYSAEVILLSPDNEKLTDTQKNSLISNIRRDIDKNIQLKIKTISYTQ